MTPGGPGHRVRGGLGHTYLTSGRFLECPSPPQFVKRSLPQNAGDPLVKPKVVLERNLLLIFRLIRKPRNAF